MQMRREGGQAVVSPGATQAHMTQLVLPQHANSLAITFGGVVRRRPDVTKGPMGFAMHVLPKCVVSSWCAEGPEQRHITLRVRHLSQRLPL